MTHILDDLFSASSIETALLLLNDYRALGEHPLANLEIVKAKQKKYNRKNNITNIGNSLHDVLRETIMELPSKARIALERQYIQKDKIKEIADGLSFSPKHYRRIRKAAFTALGKRLSIKEGLLEPEMPDDSSPVYSPQIPRKLLKDPVDRMDLKEDLISILGQGQPVIVGLIGIPGAGKTTVAVDIVHDPKIRQNFSNGILWASSGNSPNIFRLLTNWAVTLRISRDDLEKLTDLEKLADWIKYETQDKRMLFAIDDVWNEDEVRPLFSARGDNCSVIFTTRSPKLAQSFSPSNIYYVGELDQLAGEELLRNISPKSFEAEPVLSKELVEITGRLPLAITIIGKHLAKESYSNQKQRIREAILEIKELKEILTLAEPPDEPDYFPNLPKDARISLQASILLSDKALSQSAREALRLLSIFPPKPNSFGDDAALFVSQVPMIAINELVDSGLLGTDDSGRFQFHRVIAGYAASKAPIKLPFERMVGFYIKFWEEHANDLLPLENETANFETALEYAYTNDLKQLYIEGVSVFYNYMAIRGSFEAAAKHAPKAYDWAKELNDPKNIALMGICLGRIEFEQGKHQEAKNLFKEVYSHATLGKDFLLVSSALEWLGMASLNLNDPDSTLLLWNDALKIAQDDNLEEKTCDILQKIGSLMIRRGNYPEAEKCLLGGLDLSRKIDYRMRECTLLSNLGALKTRQKEYVQAESFLKTSLTLSTEIGLQSNVGFIYSQLSGLVMINNDFKQALNYLDSALPFIELFGSEKEKAHFFRNYGEAIGKTGNYQQGIAEMVKALSLARKVNDDFVIGGILAEAGELHIIYKNADAARITFEELERIGIAKGETEYEATAKYGLGRAAGLMGDYKTANELGYVALQLFSKLNDPRYEEAKQWFDSLPPA